MLKSGKPAVSGGSPVIADRAGTAMVEMAVCLPLLMMISFGAIETANAIFLKQAISQVAYEGARTAALSDATEAAILQRCNEFLTARRIKGGTVAVSPKNVSDKTNPGTVIEVMVTAPANANAISPVWFFKNSKISNTVAMVRI